MLRLATVLAVLLLILTFNAYACVLPLQTQSAVDCPSSQQEPVRQTCDAFLELGPQSQVPSAQELPTITVDFDAGSQLPSSVFTVFQLEYPPHDADTPIHLSIPTTVLRI